MYPIYLHLKCYPETCQREVQNVVYAHSKNGCSDQDRKKFIINLKI